MQVKFLRTLTGAYGIGRRDSVLDVPEKVAAILVNRGLVEEFAGNAAPKPAAEVMVPPAPDSDSGIESLRAEAEALGVEVDRRWGAKRLRSEIEGAQG